MWKCLRRVVGDEKPAHSTEGVRNRLFREVRRLFPAILEHHATERRLKRSAAARAAAKKRREDEQHLVWVLGMSVAEAREKYTPGPMRFGKPDMRRWEHGVHSHPSLWGTKLPEPDEVMPQLKQELQTLEETLFDFKLRGAARYAVCEAMGESALGDQSDRTFLTHDQWCGAISRLTQLEFMQEPDFGIVSLNIIKEYLGKRGLSLAHA